MAKIGYARVSTKEQVLDLQMDALQKAGCERIYADHGVSGILASRPQFDECLASLQSGDIFVVYSLSRAGRSMDDLCRMLTGLKARGVAFMSLTEGIDTSSHMGKMVYGILAAIAEFERNVSRERCEDGRQAARERGVKFGRKPVIPSEMVDYVRMSHADGTSVVDLMVMTGYSQTTIYRILKGTR